MRIGKSFMPSFALNPLGGGTDMIDPHHKQVVHVLAEIVASADDSDRVEGAIGDIEAYFTFLGVDMDGDKASAFYTKDKDEWKTVLTEWIEVLIRDHQQEIV